MTSHPLVEISGPTRQNGFTLVELVVVIVISAIVIGFAVMFMTAPMDAYFAQSRRSELADSSDAITRQMNFDFRRALPRSIRVTNAGSLSIVEMLVADEVAFYQQGNTVPVHDLNIGSFESVFSSLGQFRVGQPRPVQPVLALWPNAGIRLAVGNIGSGGPSDAYQNNNQVITPVATTIQLNASATGTAGEDDIQLSAPFNFQFASPTNRMFLVSDAITYICNSAANARTLRRYNNYAASATSPASEAAVQLNAAGVVNTVVARDVTACQMGCGIAGPPCQNGFTAAITVSRTTNAGTDLLRVVVQSDTEPTS